MQRSILLYPAGATSAIHYAAHTLSQYGIPLADHLSPDITHLLLDVPSFQPDGTLRSGGHPEALLDQLPSGITVLGGNLTHPVLAAYPRMDLLTDPLYTALNAGITAHCALQVAAEQLSRTFDALPVLILGWGRIGKCLAELLKKIGAHVTVAARKPSDRAMLQALGYGTLETEFLSGSLDRYRVLFNTIPAEILTEADLAQCSNCLKIELASGRMLPGSDVIQAAGLPGRYAPESSGELIAQTVIRLIKGV